MFRVEYVAVNVASLEKVEAAEVGIKEMLQAGIVRKASDLIKVLGGGDLKSAKTVRAHKFSETAIKKIEQAGGKAVVIGND
jgi:large subunit ribosomal protein L15